MGFVDNDRVVVTTEKKMSGSQSDGTKVRLTGRLLGWSVAGMVRWIRPVNPFDQRKAWLMRH